MRRSKKIVFFFPAFSSTEATAPLGILAVSTPLLRAGYSVCIIDSTITPNFQKRVLAELEDAACLAVSLVTGPMIKETVQIARAAKRLYPEKPVILGGWHPSLLPDQTLAAEYVDVVVKGQGEDALLEIMQAIEAGDVSQRYRGRGLQRGRPVAIQLAAHAEAAGRDAAEGLSSGRFRRIRKSLRQAMGDVHVEPGVSL